MSNDGTTSYAETPKSCIKGCGFWGTAANNNMCSKCFKEFQKETATKEEKLITKPQLPTVVSSAAVKVETNSGVKNRCLSCNKKVGLTGFKCRCGDTFCSLHRYPEKHECTFDFKVLGRDAIEKANPVVKADKLERM
ncbi:Zinc finger a20 and an1 domain-containing stress-associated protein [Thalictrum thalictroides]|uniref:Zinc finger a20 and an1 domain-containing stress-associated protein n=1 Tax=Thalictrum thalictroides TaxID=46969 RepID=A0A7J6USH0_THATH|nr:Zinc finger a20 and an1 domain-containing stress-associated protein [Thalictrum thalictroides]